MQLVPNVILRCSWLILLILLLFCIASSVLICNFNVMLSNICLFVISISILFITWYFVFGNTIKYYRKSSYILLHLFIFIYLFSSFTWIKNENKSQCHMYFTIITTIVLGIICVIFSIDWNSNINIISISKPTYLKCI